MKIDDRSREAFQADASLSNPAGNKPRYSKVGIGDKKVKKFCHGPQLGRGRLASLRCFDFGNQSVCEGFR